MKKATAATLILALSWVGLYFLGRHDGERACLEGATMQEILEAGNSDVIGFAERCGK